MLADYVSSDVEYQNPATIETSWTYHTGTLDVLYGLRYKPTELHERLCSGFSKQDRVEDRRRFARLFFTDGSQRVCGFTAGVFSHTQNIAESYGLPGFASVFQAKVQTSPKCNTAIITDRKTAMYSVVQDCKNSCTKRM